MRIAVLVTVSLLIAGCSHIGGDRAGQSSTSPVPSSTITKAPSVSNPAPAAIAPAAGASISDVIAWVEAGHSADAARYHSATLDGVTTPLADDIAFSAAAGSVSCVTDTKHATGTLSCLVKLTNPAPPPATSYGPWKGGWVDFNGSNLQIGSTHGDPGPFVHGNGPELATGDSLSFGDYRCRSDQTGAVCVNYARQTGIRLVPAGIEPFGCLRSVPSAEDAGTAFSCP